MGDDERQPFVDAIVQSEARHRLVVAGPGTGKTYLFGKALGEVEGEGLALTFIRNLASDLSQSLAGMAKASTLHSFCRFHLARADSRGLTSGFEYYPQLLELLAEDLEAFGRSVRKGSEVEGWLHELSEVAPLADVLRLGSYYNAVSHLDSVYRTVLHFRKNPEDIPEYPLVLIDEVQDFSPLEIALVELLATRSPTLVVGDDDQALYTFKSASAETFLKLVGTSCYERFDLPFCSRCTHIVIRAFKDVVREAQANGLLRGRMEKPFLFHASSKGEDSIAYPRIIHAKCTVETNKAPYMGRYVTQCIERIAKDDIEESWQQGYPTALVIGPRPFVGRVYGEIRKSFDDAVLRETPRTGVFSLDGYRLLAQNRRSRLGWRILLRCAPLPSTREMVCGALRDGCDLDGMLPKDYREHHLRIVEAIGGLCEKGAATEEEILNMAEASCLPVEQVRIWVKARVALHQLGVSQEQGVTNGEGTRTCPSIICTSLRGAKGLSGGHVFIVGLNNGHLPRDPQSISDDEVRSLLVALTRTRKQCHLVSCGRLGEKRKARSIFLDWLRARSEEVVVSVEFWKSRG